jgi:hypothetical protein
MPRRDRKADRRRVEWAFPVTAGLTGSMVEAGGASGRKALQTIFTPIMRGEDGLTFGSIA